MKIMFDSGAIKSFISKAALKRTKHLPININQQHYLLADGYTTFEVIGIVKIFVEFGAINTSIVVGVVNSLCIDCILGMDYINKYKVNLNTKDKQIQIHTFKDMITIPMENQVDNVKILCRLNNFTCIYPYQEKKIQISTQVSSGQLVFSPAYHLIHYKNLISPHALISIINHSAWISVYNPTSSTCYLKSNIIIGTAVPSSTVAYISTILDTQTQDTIDESNTTSLTSIGKQNIKNLIMHIQDQQQFINIQALLTRHHQLFDTTTTTIAETTTTHVIYTGDNLPTTSRPYPQTMEKQNAMFDIIQQMLKYKQIRASHSQYSAPVLLIKKRDGSYRFIVDYRKLNNITVQDNYPLPNLEQAIQMVGGHQYYTKLDLRSGYFQIPIREEDKHKTAFITVHGLYEFNVLAQGLKNSPPSFQRIMSTILLSCKKFCFIYLDDILIYSDSFQQHLDHLNQVLAILNKHKFQLNPQKCELARTTIDYLGHTLSIHGIKPLQERIEKLLAIPQPTSLKQANAFIGAIGWYRKFIKNYAKIAAPILAVTNLMTKNKYRFKWDTPQREAFDQLKNILITEPLFLNYPDPNPTFILSTDASDYCIGGVLYQEINGERKNVYFYSQMLPKLQRKWPTIEKEALAIYYCVTRMKLYLLGREFIIQTDHCPLRDMHKKPSNNRRVDRISLILQQYNIKEIRHLSGKCNCMADYLSRYPRQLEDDDEFIERDFGDIPAIQQPTIESTSTNYQQVQTHMVGAVVTRAQAKINAQLNSSTIPDTSIEEKSSIDDQPLREEGHEFDVLAIEEAQKIDKLYQTKVLEIQANPIKHTYVLENGILYKLFNCGISTRKLLYVPPTMVKQLLTAYHDVPWAAHFGFHRTYWKLKDKYWWPDMKTTIKNHIHSCLKCRKFNIDRRKAPGLLHPIEAPGGPFQLIGIDYTGPFPITPQGNKYVLAITDYFTKWVIAIPLPNQTARTTAEALYEHYICIYGVPMRILSDQGSHFNNELMVAFTQLLGCHHIKSTPYHPQTNGAIERFNSTFERQLAKLTEKDHQVLQ
ncbi:unnamed protein product [Rotaria sordida]|uniref:RNA-directed DNA polymerase n=1 Tax=Rotaria sordida TaxID=392033 RepID=A0A819WP81_9BILA|nr:unnamed protein product [Rotaria sordida]